MSTTDSFPPLMTTDNNLDPSAVVGAGVVIAACMMLAIVDCGTLPKTGYAPKTQKLLDDKGLSVSGIWRVIVLAGLLATQITAFVLYRGYLDEYGLPGYIFPRDVFAVPLSCLSFVFVAMDLTLSTGLIMSLIPDNRPEKAIGWRLAIYYWHFIWWVAFFSLGGAMTYRSCQYLIANTDNNGTYPDNFYVLCVFTLAASIVTIAALFRQFATLYSEGDLASPKNRLMNLVGATRYHGFLGVQTSYMEMEFPFIVGTCFYTGAIFMLIYKDYYQGQALSCFIVFTSLLATFLSKNLGTFTFYFAVAIWIATTVSYIATDAATGLRSGLDPAQWGNPGANIGLPQLNISTTVTAVSFPTTLSLLTGLSFAALTAYGFTAVFNFGRFRAEIRTGDGL